MTWWWRARALTTVTTAFVVSLVAAVVIGGEALPLPSLVGSMLVPVVFALLLPLIPTVLLFYGVDRSYGDLDATAVRAVALRDVAAILAMVSATAVTMGAAAATGSWQLGPGYLRNLLGCLGLARIVAPYVGTRLAAVAPVAAVIISALFGTGAGGSVQWWAWPIADARSGWAFGVAVLLFAVGLAIPYRRRRWVSLRAGRGQRRARRRSPAEPGR